MAGRQPRFQVASTQPAGSVADEITGAAPAHLAPQSWVPRAAPAAPVSGIPGNRQQRDLYKLDAWLTAEQHAFVLAAAGALKRARQGRLPKGKRATGPEPPGPSTVVRLALDVLMELAGDLGQCTGDEARDRELLLAAIRGRL